MSSYILLSWMFCSHYEELNVIKNIIFSSLLVFLCNLMVFCNDRLWFPSFFLSCIYCRIFSFWFPWGLHKTLYKYKSILSWWQLNLDHVQKLYPFTVSIFMYLMSQFMSFYIVYPITNYCRGQFVLEY